MSAPSDIRAVEELGRELARLLGDGALPPEAADALRSLIALSERLASDKVDMAAMIAAQEGRIAELAAQVAALTGQIALLQRDLYGSRSERRREDGDTSDDNQAARGKDRRRGGRPGRTKQRGDAVNDTGLRFNDRAPVIDIAVTPPEIEGLSEDDYEVISERVHCRLAALECRHVVIRYRHLKVKLRETGALVGGPARESLFKNSCADVSFVAALLIDKFLWHLPLYRQHRMLDAAGIAVNRGSLSLWANRAIALLKPIHDAQWRSVLQGAVIQMDETPIRAGRHPGKPGSMKKGYFWPVLGEEGEVVFPFAASRAHRHAAEFLGDYAGTLVSDGYGAYEAYVAARDGAVRHQGCWIHTRRNFWEQKDNHPAMAGEALASIGAIYKIEEEIDGKPTAERTIARRTRSRAAVEAFWEWCEGTLETAALTPKHPIRKAIGYAVERRATLEVFLSDPDVPPDTNLVENRIRPAKLGQRNWLFAWTELGAENVGIVNGLLATCRMQDVDPRVWLTDVLLRIDTHPASRVDELTPRRWKTLFADDPLTSDVAAATAGRLHAAASGIA
ncbi:MAG: IS66 family transposase [Rhodospirillales bacterium]|nr:IS66 family transposase [Rhodospirillales bacterium]